MSATYCGACRATVHDDVKVCSSCGTDRPDHGWPVDPMVGRLVDGKYRVDRRLSAGGFGTVFVAKQLHGNTELGTVVLKFLHAELAHDPRVVKRFVTEARSARELTSPHVVRVFDLGMMDDGVPFMVQEYVVGEGLDAILHREGPLSLDRVVRIGMQVAEAMAEAHAKGILHRDLKPENLRVQQTIQGDFVKVLDFGIARVEQGTGTATNSFIGTPRYMAPEQIKQKGVDARADVFALGVILFELMTGQPPIPAETDMEYIHLNIITPPRDVRTLRAGVPDGLADIVMSMMAKEKSERPAGMPTVYESLDALPPMPGSAAPRGGASRAPGPTPVPQTRLTPLGQTGPRPSTQRTPAPPPAVETVTTMPARRILLFGGAAVAAAALVLVGVAISGGSNATPATASATAVPATAAPPLPATVAPATSMPATSAPASAIAATTVPETAAPTTASTDRNRRRRDGQAAAPTAPTPPASPPSEPTTSAARVQKIDD